MLINLVPRFGIAKLSGKIQVFIRSVEQQKAGIHKVRTEVHPQEQHELTEVTSMIPLVK